MELGDTARGLALCFILVFLVGTAVGSVLPEFGNLLAQKIGIRAHFFNVHFLVLGIMGISVALYLGYTDGGSGS